MRSNRKVMLTLAALLLQALTQIHKAGYLHDNL